MQWKTALEIKLRRGGAQIFVADFPPPNPCRIGTGHHVHGHIGARPGKGYPAAIPYGHVHVLPIASRPCQVDPMGTLHHGHAHRGPLKS